MTPKMSSYWLYFITSTSYKLATALVGSLKVEVVCRDSKINELLQIKPISYKEALSRALVKIEEDNVASSWKDSLVSGSHKGNISEYLKIPTKDCFIDQRNKEIKNKEYTINKIWSIGGESGGVGTKRGRTNRHKIHPGDSLDFWRVVYSNKEEGKLILFAEMKLPREA
jgi:hypothetical protein